MKIKVSDLIISFVLILIVSYYIILLWQFVCNSFDRWQHQKKNIGLFAAEI